MGQAALIAAAIIGGIGGGLLLLRGAGAPYRWTGVAVALVGLLAAGALVASLGGVTPSPPAPPGPAEPGPDELAPLGPPRVFDAHTLYQEIDGGADVYVRRGLTAATFRDFRAPSGAALTLEVYALGGADGARAVLAEAVSPTLPRVVGPWDEAVGDDQGVDARCGATYVRVTHAADDPTGLAAPMLSLARAALAGCRPEQPSGATPPTEGP